MRCFMPHVVVLEVIEDFTVNKAILDSTHRPGTQLTMSAGWLSLNQILVGISAVRLVVFCRRLGIHTTHRRAIV